MKKQIEKSNRGYVLAEGEVTGHYHAIADEIEMYEDGGVLTFANFVPATITHQEHAPLTIRETHEEVGDHTVGIVREFDPFREEARKVVD